MTIRRLQDPDVHEPNNGAHLATSLNSGQTATGFGLYVWVNDVDFNDWDEVEPYSFRVELIEGCSAQCSPLLCDR